MMKDIQDLEQIKELSKETLFILHNTISVVLDYIDIHNYNRLTGIGIPLKKFEDKGVSSEDAKAVLEGIRGCKVLKSTLKGVEKAIQPDDLARHLSNPLALPISNEELKEYYFGLPLSNDCLYLVIGDESELKRINNVVKNELETRSKIIESKKEEGTETIPIKHIRLSDRNSILEINKGENDISFRSKKGGEGQENQKKNFKILSYLWESHREQNHKKIFQKGSYETIENIVKMSGCKSAGAVRKQIQRLNKLFIKKGVAIKIEGENSKFRLTIIMG